MGQDKITESGSSSYSLLLDQDVLECPICCELLDIPIYQCNNGHISCFMCIEKIKKICPSCKLPIRNNRCRALERVIEASTGPCPNAKSGCKENVSYRNRPSHEKQCVFSPCSCPVRGCNYTGSYKELKNHASVKHEEDLVPFFWETSLVVNSILREKITILREMTDGEMIVVQGFNGSHGRFVNVSCIAPLAAETGGFVCRLKLSTLPSVMKQTLVVKKVQKMSDEEPQDDFMLIPSYMLRGVLNTLKVCIVRGSARVDHV